MSPSAPAGDLRERWFGLVYDPFARVIDPAVDEHRAWLAADLEGTVLDLGCGSGLQFPHFAAAGVGRVVGVEPNDRLREQAAERARSLGLAAELHDARGEALPLADASVDAVVCSMVLCSVASVDAVLDEVERVLVPGGELRLFEHVHDDGWRGRLQRAIQPVWGPLADGCHLTRRTDAVAAARDGLDVLELERTGPHLPPANPFVRGRFRRRA